MTELNLTDYGIVRPEKIIWRFPEHVSDVLAAMKSKTLRKFLQNTDQELSSNGITYEYKKLSDEEFLAWLPYYEKKMSENGYDLIASPAWLAKKKEQGVTLDGMFFYQHGEMVGSGIFTRNENHKATFAFKASERIDLGQEAHASLGAIIDYLFLKEMSEQHVEVISAGRSRNAFGVINNLGYVDYKLKFGYTPTFTDEETILTTLPLNEKGICICYGKKEGKRALFAFKPKGTEMKFEVARFATPELPFIEVEY